MAYTRVATTTHQQIDILRSRGLQIADEKSAMAILEEVGYFRFKGYCLPFYGPEKERFRSGVDLEQIYQTYRFDTDVKALTLQACQRAETRFKSIMGNTLALTLGSVLPDTAFYSVDRAKQWHARAAKAQVDGSSRGELYVDHYTVEYEEFPIWVDLELTSFGNASMLYSWLDRDLQRQVAARYGVRYPYIQNWMHVLTVIRNTCAHNSRIYGRHLALNTRIPSSQSPYFVNGNFFSVLFVLYKVLARKDFAVYLQRMKTCFDSYQGCVAINWLGFPDDWFEHCLGMM
ncbi:Abi family protein [Lacticaseibacillus mingshuiensis]|uniref:Abi family protein n=1 Tax=Lacticaseibacillus mingshuiensis TaxID=2799574 RepID=A0ABW4CIL6_9LACO|nr:Abi family protein [Lacticaseibacillus mingshuiensis]